MITGLIAAFSMPKVEKRIDNFATGKEKRMCEGLAYIGEGFANRARDIRTYEDRTSNLRGSIAYDVVKNGKTFASDYSGGGNGDEDAKYYAKKAVDDVIFENSLDTDNRIWLIGVAGMEYAAAVESKGYDVITASVPEDTDVKSFLTESELID